METMHLIDTFMTEGEKNSPIVEKPNTPQNARSRGSPTTSILLVSRLFAAFKSLHDLHPHDPRRFVT